MKNKKIYLGAGLELFILICASFAFSYILKENSNDVFANTTQSEPLKKNLLKKILQFIIGDSSFVSAADSLPVNSCIISKNGSICNEYPTEECSGKCAGNCIPSRLDSVAECKLGTCYYEDEGICQIRSPKKFCEESNGRWFSDINGNINECRRGCCILNRETDFVTAKECEMEAAALGIQKDFRENVVDHLACLGMANSDEEGACVFPEQDGNSCRFITKTQCANSNGQYHSGILCSNPELNTKCLPQKSVGCAPENERITRDEVYWYDSCGNRENIYDADKVKSFNGGRVLSKEQSCQLFSGNNLNANQRTCGNCNRLLGSICGEKTASERLADSNHEFVCKNLGCTDENGNKRENGESWCVYQGSIGVDAGISTARSSDTVGSGHFRKSCINGEVITEPCTERREGICVESKTTLPQGGSFSTASCRINRAWECYGYNSGKKSLCDKNPDCFTKKVNVAENFKFDFCVPKYKPGFDLSDTSDFAEKTCSLGTQTCKYVKIKKLSGSKEINKECLTEKFTQQMNDFCMSLGDCGASANYLGTVEESYTVTEAPKLGAAYLSDIAKYADEKKFLGKVADPGKLEDYYGELGIPGNLGSAQTPGDKTAALRSSGSMIAGAFGTLLPIIAHTALGSSILGTIGLAHGAIAATTGGTSMGVSIVGGEVATSGIAAGTPAASPALSAAGGALAGAAIGFALTSFLIDITGVGRGLDPAMTYSLMAAGAIGGAMAGYAFMQGGTGALAAGVGLAGVITLVVVIVIIIIMAILGIGKVQEKYVKFTCLPWQAPAGGNECSKCGSDGKPCSAYSCSSLGQSCQIINEDLPDEIKCISVAANDTIAPIIKPLAGSLPVGYRYEETETGVKVKSNEVEGCIKETYRLILAGISLNEPGQCGMSKTPLTDFDKMEPLAGGNRYLMNHTVPLMLPSLESFGYASFDPRAKADVNLYIKCQDKAGNKNGRDYTFSFCLKQGNDTTPPVITDREPFLESVSFNLSELNATVYVSEPADCKWSLSDKNYGNMENSFECLNEIGDMTIRGFTCNAMFPIRKNESIFYVRCLDQPWMIGENASKRNPSVTSYQYKVKRVSSALRIDSLSPENGTLIFGTEPATVEVVAHTTGGLNGNAKCYFKNGELLQTFYETLGATHRQTFNQILAGNLNYTVFCEDIIGNTAERTAKVTIKIDNELPKVSRAYKDSGDLFVITDEPADCFFSTRQSEKCKFSLANGTAMIGSEKIHTTDFDNQFIYFIKCKDRFGHGSTSDSCSIIVKEGSA